MNDYFLELKRQQPINYNGLIIYPITFGYICDNIGLPKFNTLFIPFVLTKECFDNKDITIDSFNLFEDIILKDENLLISFVSIITLFCKCSDIKLSNNNSLLLFFNNKESFVIDKNNFEDISEIIRKICGKEKIEIEVPPKNMTPRQKDVWEKLQIGRKKENKKNEVHIYDMLNICEYGGNYRIPQKDLDNMTLWNIKNCYKSIVDIKTYNDSLKICLVSGEGKNISGNNHWHQKLLIRD